MSASKTGMTRYIRNDGQEVFAAQIASITDFPNPDNAAHLRGAKTLTFTDGREAHLIPAWAAKYQLSVGGYFVAFDAGDKTDAIYESESSFAANYRLE